MSYIGNSPSQTAFLTDQFSGTGSQTAFTMSVAPANTASCIVAVSGVLQDPSTYAVVGTTLNFTVAPPAGSGNISVRYLGIPASGVTTTAYRTATEFTATSGQTTFTPPSYTVGYLDVYRNGVLLGSADYTATNGTTVVLATGCVAGDLVETISFYVSSVLNAIPNTAGSISSSNLPAGLTINTPTISSPTITTPSISSPTITTAATLPAATTIGGINYTPYTMKNRIINGDMVISQRYGTSSVTPANDSYTLDRWKCYQTTASKYSVQQNAGSVTPPAGYINYLGITSLSAYSVLSSDYYTLQQVIEGFNCSDLAWGTANAKTITISFWVRSSLTGTFGGAIFNDAGNRSYPFTYTISSANTWEYETITIPGDTSGTWLTNNGKGIQLAFSLGAGSTNSGTAGAWAGTFYASATGATSVVGTNGATFYVTGVQLEVGSYATSYEWLPYGTELALCQRYLPAFGGTTGAIAAGFCAGTTTAFANVVFPVTARTPATGITVPNATHFTVYNSGAAGITATALAFSTSSNSSATVNISTASGLVAGNGTIFLANNAAAQLLFTGCEL